MEEDNGASVFSLLPEGCISHILSLTSPKDACRSSAVSWGFKSASESDIVWERFLPQDYKEIILNSVPPLSYSTKKELFFRFCQSPVLLNHGTLSFWLNQSSGKKCYVICARELSIAGKDNPQRWKWTSIAESWFSEVAEMLNVRRVDIVGRMQTRMLSPNTYYAAYLVFKIAYYSYGLCFMDTSVKFTNGAGGDERNKVFLGRMKHNRHLFVRRSRRPVVQQRTQDRIQEERDDGWKEIYLGRFFTDEGDNEIEMQLYENRRQNWKKGLIIEGVELRPLEDS